MLSINENIANPARVKFLSGLFIFVSLILVARLFNWQILRADSLALMAKSQHESSSSLPAHRGSIYSSDSFPLATSSESYLVWASLPDVGDKEKTAEKLAPLFANPEIQKDATTSAKTREAQIFEEQESLRKSLAKTSVVWVPLKHKVSKETKLAIASLNLPGIGFDLEESRSYAESSMAAQLLGFVGKDEAGIDKGYFGLEGYYDLTLSGRAGKNDWEKDAFGNPILLGLSQKVIAQDGLNLQTNIDRAAQYLVEKKLEAGIKLYQASGGMVVAMNPSTGGIIAMAGAPTFSPEKYSQFDKSLYTNPSISESFEPGSIFKVLIMAAALDSGDVTPDTKCERCSGPRVFDKYTIESGTKQYYPDTNMIDIIFHSDNIGMIWVAEKMGLPKLYSYLQKYGIGQPTGIDLQGETTPKLRPEKDWALVDLATASFGQGVAVTAIEMVRAVSAIANKGRMPAPQIVNRVIGEGVDQAIQPKLSDQIISEKASREITDMMVNNVDKRDDWKKPKGFKIAGKTGTAQVPISGHYDPAKTVASFVGFAPAYNPKYVMIVSLKDPKAAPFASQTAAPLWFSITNELLPLLGAQPE